jgi:hypothetical protein
MIKTKEREVKSLEIAYYPFSSGNGLTAHLVEKTLESINGLTDHFTDAYRRKNTDDNGPHISHVK